MTKLRIFLADDHAVVRAGLKTLINGDAGMEVVGEASDGAEVVAQVPALTPDVVVLDVSMPNLNGAQATAKLRATTSGIKILALSVHEDRSYLRELLEAGAHGYVLKRAAAGELLSAIKIVAGGGVYVDPSLAGELVRTFVNPKTGAAAPANLSDREEKVLRLTAEGYSTKEVASILSIGIKTVETYKARAMEKLGLKSRVDIVSYAKAAGWFRGSL